MVALARSVWGLNLEATAQKLRNLGFAFPSEPSFQDQIEDYIRWTKADAELESLWNRARERLFADWATNKLGGPLKWPFSSVPGDMRGACCDLFGLTTCRDVVATFCPSRVVHGKRGRTSVQISHDFPRGGYEWDEILALPFRELPGRITSFLFIGRQSKYPEDFIYRRAHTAQFGNEFGAWFPPDLICENQTIVAFSDVVRAGRLHLKNYRHGLGSCPIVVWYEGAKVQTKHTWELFANKQLVFWEDQMTPAVLRNAIRTGGLISSGGALCERVAMK